MERLKFMIYSQDLLTIEVHLMLKKYYQISCQLIENPIIQIMSY